jgi:hypothetical protein
LIEIPPKETNPVTIRSGPGFTSAPALVLDRAEDRECIDVDHPVLGYLEFDATEQHRRGHDGGWVVDFDLTEINFHPTEHRRGTPTPERGGSDTLVGATEDPHQVEIVGHD